MPSPSPQLLRALRSMTASPLRALPRTPRPIYPFSNLRIFSNTHHRFSPPPPSPSPKSHDRGPQSTEKTQTDFSNLNVLGGMPPPTTAIDACLSDGFHLDNGVKVAGGSGIMLVSGEAFGWQPWEAANAGTGTQGDKRAVMINKKGQWEVGREAWGLLEMVWPKPDMLILGLGANIYPIAPSTRKHINDLGIRVEIQDTRNAAAQFNLLATERGTGSIAAAMIPIG